MNTSRHATDLLSPPANAAHCSLLNRRTIGGIEFEAVRFDRPCPHWRLRVVATGYLFQSGCFRSQSRPQLWESVEHTARLRRELWAKDCLTAHDARSDGAEATYVLWGIRPDAPAAAPREFGPYDFGVSIAREREGWICAAYRSGEQPAGLTALAGLISASAVAPVA